MEHRLYRAERGGVLAAAEAGYAAQRAQAVDRRGVLSGLLNFANFSMAPVLLL
jgi:hypothetical protein